MDEIVVAKRARTQIADAPAAKPNSNWRDWANLTAGPADLIVEHVLADDVASYLRYRAVCSSWRRCTASPHAPDRRFHPRHWIMLPQTSGNRRGFLNVTTGEHILVNIPELRRHFMYGATSDGLVVLCDKKTYVVRLLNPLTRQLTDFPDGTTMLTALKSPITSWRQWRNRLQKLPVFGAGPADDSSTLALHSGYRCVAVAQPGVKRWKQCGHRSLILATLSFANSFYCVTNEGIMVVDITTDSKWTQLVVAAEGEQGFGKWPYPNTVNLVDNDGELILVNSEWESTSDLPGKYEVHRVDLDTRQIVPINGLRGRAVFVSGDCHRPAISVPAGLSSSIRSDTVYRCSAWADGRCRIDAYNLQDGSIERDICRDKIVDYLSRYISPSEDIVVRVRPAAPRKRKHNPKVIGNDWVNYS